MNVADRGRDVAGVLRGTASSVQARLHSLWRSVSWRSEYYPVYVRAWLQRSRLRNVTFVGITGSAGKTTTKELSAAILETLGPCASSPGTSNEPIDIARTVWGTTAEHRACVVELAATRPNCLDEPLRMLRPDISVLTLVAHDHYSAFKSEDAIAAEKGKLVHALSAGGTAVLNIDDPRVRAVGQRCKGKVIWIGESEQATLRLRSARSEWPDPLTLEVEYQGKSYEVRTALHGTQLALSVLAALGVGVAAGVPIERAIGALANAGTANGRMQIVRCEDGVVFVRDDWKAPVWSLQAPLDFMKAARATRKVVIVGTLSDYSLSASKLYPKVARQAMEVGDLVVFVGPHALRALKARQGSNVALQAFPDMRDAAAYLRTALRAGDLVLLKGSNRADHLVRLMLDRSAPVQCWRDACRRTHFCDRCSLLYQPMPTTEVPHPVSSGETGSAEPVVRPEVGSGPVIVGLGNPGDQYRHTPHNVGHRIVDSLARAAQSDWETHPEGLVSTIRIDDRTVTLLKPAATVNRSGPPVRRLLDAAGCDAGCVVIIHDDVDLALGDVRLKCDGGDAGHKGVRSLITALGTSAVPRIRVGVRRPGDQREARALVLTRFSAAEEAALARGIEQATAQARELIRCLPAS